MDKKEIVLIDAKQSVQKSSALDVENRIKCNNFKGDNPVNVAKDENVLNCAEEPRIVRNGSIDAFISDTDKITNDIEHLHLNSPSTSNICSTSNSEVEKSMYDLTDVRSNDSDSASLSQNYSDASISRGRPSTLPLESTKRRVLKISPEEISSPDSPLSEEESKFISPETDSQDELENSIMVILNNSHQPEMIPELTLDEEQAELRNWKACTIAGITRQIDLKVIEPYKRVLSHGGYLNTGSHNAIITFSACFLPHKSRKDYNYVMDNLFFYILHTLNQLVTDDYVLVYLHGGTTKDRIPTFSWLKRCYQMIDRKLKKNLKALYLVHPTFWLRTLVTMIKPFISSKFSRKIHFVNSLTDLSVILPIEEASIPDKVRQYDRIKMSLLKK